MMIIAGIRRERGLRNRVILGHGGIVRRCAIVEARTAKSPIRRAAPLRHVPLECSGVVSIRVSTAMGYVFARESLLGIPHRVRMRVRYDFHDLFTMEMANNHSGSVEHGKRIIREIGEVVAQTKAANLSQYAATLCLEVKPRHTPVACRCVRR